MYKLVIVAVLSLGLPTMTFAQPIHGHPQKAAYASPAEWVPLNDQCWFGDPDPIKASHVHVIPRPPSYMQVTDLSTYDVPFTVQLHNVPGTVGQVGGEHVQSIRWDATGSSQLPVMKGDPHGLLEWTGVATMSHTIPSLADDFLEIFQFPKHGWAEDKIIAYTGLDDGRRLDTGAVWPVYSAIDLTVPEKPGAEQGNPGVLVRTSCVMWSGNQAETAGEVITQLSDYIPLAPIFKPWVIPGFLYNYTAPAGINFPAETFEQRKDPDLHHGITGVLQRQEVSPAGGGKSFKGDIVIDPASLGTGTHKEMFVWTQPLLNGTALSAVMVIPVSVGEGIPPPTLCTDPTATNQGQSLPCTFLPPPVLIVVPSLVGEAQGIAVAQIVNAGLALGSVTLDPASSLPNGDVVNQSPVAGATVVPGSAVNLVVSSPPIITPPIQTVYTFTCDPLGNCKLTLAK